MNLKVPSLALLSGLGKLRKREFKRRGRVLGDGPNRAQSEVLRVKKPNIRVYRVLGYDQDYFIIELQNF